jgi:hypothetical protein
MKPLNEPECLVASGGTSPANPDDGITEPVDPRDWNRAPRYPRDVIDPVPYLPDQAY